MTQRTDTWNPIKIAIVILCAAIVTFMVPRIAHARTQDSASLSEAQTISLRTVTPADSARALRTAQRLQETFERYRRERLPRLLQSAGERCENEERIGRFCYWHREGDTLIPEPSSITTARLHLLTHFDTLRLRTPRDPWVTGQYVRYLVEAGYDSSAYLAARICESDTWWCLALQGYALHAMQRFADAEQVFDSALVLMPQEQRCQWNDIALLLPEQSRARYANTPCPDRAEREKRYWQLADPAYIAPGNDRRTEHYARVVTATLLQKASNIYGMPWGNDMYELIIRYGMPHSYGRTWPQSMGWAGSIVGHDREPSYHFAASATPELGTSWNLRAKGVRERYSPAYVTRIDQLDAQFALFKRGDSAIVMAIYRDTSKTPAMLGVSNAEHTAISAGEVFSADPLTPLDSLSLSATSVPVLHPVNIPKIQRMRTTWKGMVIGVERYDTTTRVLERARAWLEPPAVADGAPALSTLLLFGGDDSVNVASLDDAIRYALAGNVAPSSRKLGVYWEMYGLPRDSVTQAIDSAVTVSLSVARTQESGFFRRIAESLGLMSRTVPVTVGWNDLPGTPDGVSKSVVVDLSELVPGTYRITLAAGRDAQRQTTTTREIEIR